MYSSQHLLHLRFISLVFLLAAIAVLVLASCGEATSTQNGSTKASAPRPTPTISPSDALHASATAMRQLKSTHFTFSIASMATEAQATPSASSSSSPSGPVAILNTPGAAVTGATVDEVLPDQTQTSLNEPKILEVVKGGQVYIQTLRGKWYQFPNSQETTNCLGLPAVTKYTDPLATFLPLVQDSNITDHGTEQLNGQSLRHITLTLGSNAFDALADLGLVYGRILGGNPRQELVKLDNAVLDVWIDEATSYVHHLTLKSNTSFDRSSLPKRSVVSSTSSTILKMEKDLTMDYSQFNQVASIATPANATTYVASTPPALPGLCPFELTSVINAG